MRTLFRNFISMSDKEGIVEAFPSGTVTSETTKPQKWYHLFGRDISHISVDAGYETGSETSSLEESVVKNTHNVFEAPEATEIYKLVEGFEGTHRFDPSATWTQEEEKTLVRRVCFAQRTSTPTHTHTRL
jgi:hypothetical protein